MFEIENLEMRKLFSAAVKAVPFNPIAASLVNTAVTAVPVNTSVTFISTAVTAHVSKAGTLIIQGTSSADQISLSTTKPGKNVNIIAPAFGPIVETRPTIYLTSTTNGTTTKVGFDGALDIKRIYIEGAAGNDNIRIGSDVKLKATILGGKGNDTLIGGPLGDTISGGNGNDIIEAADSQATFKAVVMQNTQTKPVGGKLFMPGTKETTTSPAQFIVTGGGTAEQPSSADLLEGNAGNDTIHSGVGPDTVDGGAGTDFLVESDRGTAPKHLTIAGEKPVDFNGLTVISIDVVESDAITIKPTSGESFEFISTDGTINAINLSNK